MPDTLTPDELRTIRESVGTPDTRRLLAHIDTLTAAGRAWMTEQVDHDHPMTEAEERLMRLFRREPHDA